jgi:hypothetical protein
MEETAFGSGPQQPPFATHQLVSHGDRATGWGSIVKPCKFDQQQTGASSQGEMRSNRHNTKDLGAAHLFYHTSSTTNA